MGIGAGIARGCASGQALSGGGSLATGSWAFMMMFFAGAYATATVRQEAVDYDLPHRGAGLLRR